MVLGPEPNHPTILGRPDIVHDGVYQFLNQIFKKKKKNSGRPEIVHEGVYQFLNQNLKKKSGQPEIIHEGMDQFLNQITQKFQVDLKSSTEAWTTSWIKSLKTPKNTPQ